MINEKFHDYILKVTYFKALALGNLFEMVINREDEFLHFWALQNSLSSSYENMITC